MVLVTTVSGTREWFPCQIAARVSRSPHTPVSVLGCVGEGLGLASSQGTNRWGSSDESMGRWANGIRVMLGPHGSGNDRMLQSEE